MAKVEEAHARTAAYLNDDTPVLLDEHHETGQNAEVFRQEIQHKLTASRRHHNVFGARGSTGRGQPGSRIVDEEQQGKDKSRLEQLFSIGSNASKDVTPARSPVAVTFKPIKLAVAKARTSQISNQPVADGSNGQQDGNGIDTATAKLGPVQSTDDAREARTKRTTTVLPGSGAVLDSPEGEDDDDDGASYIEMARPPSESGSSSGDSMTTVRDQDGSIFDWLQTTAEKKTRPFRSRTSTAVLGNDVPDEREGFTASTSMSKSKSKGTSSNASDVQRSVRRSRKGSRISSQGDLESPSAATASIPAERQRSGSVDLLGVPKRTDTIRQKVLGRTNSTFRVPDANGFAKRQIPFFSSRRKRRRRKKKGRNGTNSSDSDSDSLLDDEDLFHETLLRAGLLDKDVPQEMVTEAMYENQRGVFLLGARYAKNALVPGDPAPWTDMRGNVTGYNIANYPLPTPAWRWYHSEWLVNMMGDVDSEGFQYSTRFSSKFWRGIPEIRFFVRRRLWIRTRYRPLMKAQKITELTRTPRGHLTSTGGELHIDNQAALAIAPGLARGSSKLFKPVLATHLDMYNPFISWYDAKREFDNNEPADTESATLLKQDVIHANFVRVAKVLVRRMGMDRRRLAWWEYWLGASEAPMRVTEASMKDLEAGTGKERILHQINEHENLEPSDKQRNADNVAKSRPDIRDVWDLLEDRLDDVLGLFEYQESRRQLLLLLQKMHNSSHIDHRYQNRSNSPDVPVELTTKHTHGGSEEMGNSISVRARNGDGTHSGRARPPRLEFREDLDQRLREMQIATTSLSDTAP